MTDMPKAQDIQIIEKKECYRGFYTLDEYFFRVPNFDKTLGKPISREVANRGNAAGILLYDAKRDELVFIEQFRPGVFIAGEYPWILECVAGIVEKGETGETVVMREAFEESGCTVTDVVPIADYFSSPGGMTERLFLFCGRIDSTKHADIAGLKEEGEDIRVRVVSGDETMAMLHRGEFKNGLTLIACQWFAMNREELKKKWG